MMIDFFKAALLGIVEGLTEFIPVSSTAHLLLTSYLVDFTSVKNNLFEIVIQFGAILAILVIYRHKILDLILHPKQSLVLNLIVAFLPAALIGGLFHSSIKTLFFNNLTIAIALILGGLMMIIIDRKPCGSRDENGLDNIKLITALYIGLFQCVAMIPGISRSGATIIGGLLFGLSRKTATEFSFFLALPTIAAASIFDFYKNFSALSFENLELILVGLITSFLSAILVIKWFLAFVSKHSFIPFGIYRITVGALVLIFLL